MGKLTAQRRIDNLMAKFGGRCCYCSVTVVKRARGVPKAIWATADHAEPKHRANGKPYNRKLACHACNNAKGPLTEAQFILLRGNPKALRAAKRLANEVLERERSEATRRRLSALVSPPPPVSS